MKVLLISYIFAPQNAIAAVRTTKIAKYLERIGYDVSVICGPSNTCDPILKRDMGSINRIETIDNYHFYNKHVAKPISSINNISQNKDIRHASRYKAIKKLIKLLPNPFSVYLELFRSFLWYKRVTKESNLLTNRYDIIISSFGPISNHLLGLYAEKMNKHSLWIADYRDPMVIDRHRGTVRILYRYYQKRFLDRADISFCVSDGLKSSLSKVNRKAKIYTIRNGFDEEDVESIKMEHNSYVFQKNKLILSYCGTLYAGKRDFSPLFSALSKLVTAGEIDIANIEMHYAGPDFALLSNMAQKYEVQNILVNHAIIPRDKALNLTRNADIALLASWNTKTSKGVITGKVYELFMMRKMILCFISGEISNSELKVMIKGANAGYVYEQADSDMQSLEDQLLKVYQTKMMGYKIVQQVNDNYIKQFSYDTIAEQINDIIHRSWTSEKMP